MTDELADLRRRIELLEDRLVAAAGANDPTMDVRRLRWDVARQAGDLERRVHDRLKTRTHERTEHSPTFTGGNAGAVRAWAGQRCSLPDEDGGLRLIQQGQDGGVLRSGDHLEADPDTGRISVIRARDFDPRPLYEEAQL